MNNGPTILWFRSDLRLFDNHALIRAAERGTPVLPVYILDEGGDRRPLGGASRWWLHHSLQALAAALAGLGLRLRVFRGDPAVLIPNLVRFTGAGLVVWNRRFCAEERALDTAIKADLKAQGIAAESFNSHLLREPWQVSGGTGQPYKVFTPYWKASLALGPFPSPLPAPRGPLAPAETPPLPETDLTDLALLPTRPDWAGGLRAAWTPGEAGARAALATFINATSRGYAERRDVPGVLSTSRLSPHLTFGEISPRQIMQALDFTMAEGRTPASPRDKAKFEAEVGWREFAYHVLFSHPDLRTTPMNPRFAAFPWHDDAAALRSWQKGLTGYPLVDAGMRELWQTGYMHNRVRMVAASFLIKHLGIDWRQGEAWFWDTLVDADPASNPFGWQWVAGCGADAAPYYRIFNPVLQGLKFDADGSYVRRYVPELAGLPDEHLHAPWQAPAAVLARAGVQLGITYPRPIVDHSAARDRAMADYRASGE